MGLDIDRSFVAVVPLGGRHVNHLWRLLNDLDIPYATLLDLDWGRAGGGWGHIKTTCTQLLANNLTPQDIFGQHLNPQGPAANLVAFDALPPLDFAHITQWVQWLRQFKPSIHKCCGGGNQPVSGEVCQFAGEESSQACPPKRGESLCFTPPMQFGSFIP